MLTHEENARKVHPEAKQFKVATKMTKAIGWTFLVPRDYSKDYSREGYSWVDMEGNASSDIYYTRHEALGVLKSYIKVKRQAPEKSA